MARVIISAGHTINNPGTTANGLREVDLTSKIAKAVIPYLRASGVMTLSVPPNIELSQRIVWINKTGYKEDSNDIALEIHINDGGKSGIEVWYEADGKNKSEQLAKDLLEATTSETGLPSQGTKSEYEHEFGSLAFVHETYPIGILIECGYIDNDSDAAFLKKDENLEKMGKGIARGILKYLNIELKEAPSVKTQPTTMNTVPIQNPTPITATPKPQMPSPARPMPKPTFDDFDDDLLDDLPAAPNTFSGMGTGLATPPAFGGIGNTAKPGAVMSREERKDMISKNYTKILGREPNQNDLNYFLNIGINEPQLLQKIVDSQEHADLVKARHDVLKSKNQIQEQTAELEKLRAQVADQNKVIDQLNQAIVEKNQGLYQQQQQLSNFYKTKNSQILASGSTPDDDQPKKKYRGTFLDRLFKAFSDVFE